MIGRTLGIAGMLALVVVACGGAIDESGSGTDDATTGASASEFNRAFCDLVAGTCCPRAGLPYTASGCLAEYTPAHSEGMTYDPVAGAACLDALRGAQSRATFCTDLSLPEDSTGAACTVVYMPTTSGKAKPGEACRTNIDCAPSSEGVVWCEHSTTSPTGQFCQIQRHAKEGDPCEAEWQNNGGGGSASDATSVGWCRTSEGLYCDFGTKTCTKRPGVGESCAANRGACVDGTYCASSTVTCTPVNAVGADCTGSIVDDGECLSSAYCDSTTKKCTTAPPVGAPCTTPASCGPGNRCTNGTCIVGVYSTSAFCGK